MIHNIISGIIFSEFNEKVGPYALAYFPLELSQEILKKVSSITIDFFVNETVHQETLYLLPFPLINKKGLVRSIIWSDSKKRGGISLASLTLMFDENNDTIFYKYLKDFEDPFDQVAKNIIDLRKNNNDVKDIQNLLEDFHSEIVHTLENLSEQELQIKNQIEEFPDSKYQSGEKINYNFKIIVIGDPFVGKTSTILKFSDNAFRHSYIPTVGVNISMRFVRCREKGIQLFLWDLAGQSKYQKSRHQFYQGAQGAILVYDLTDRQSFDNISKWYDDLMRSVETESNKMQLILCGNKKDLVDKIKMSTNEGKELAGKLKINFFETSARTGENIKESFLQLIDNLLTQPSPEKINK